MNDKYVLDTDANKEFLNEIRDELIRFGSRFPSPGGSSYYLGDDGTPWKDRPRETWITSRMAHVYSIAYTLNRDEADKKLAEAAILGLTGELKDRKNGGWYPGINPDGSYIEGKQCYAHAFVILAATSAYLAKIARAKDLLDEALGVYDKYFWDENEGLSVDTWNTEFTKLDEYRGLNANMHTVEAFLAVWDACGDSRYLKRAGRIIDHVIGWARDNEWRIPEHFDQNWVPDLERNINNPADRFKPYGATPGHGIEWARLITQWVIAYDRYTKSLSDGIDKSSGDFAPSYALDDYFEAALNLYNRARDDAWNVGGSAGIAYTTDWNGKPVVSDRMHWTLAEAINTSAMLAHVNESVRYKDNYSEYMAYLDKYVLDHEKGSWFHQLDSDNQLLTTVWPGKSDLYHAFQSTLIPYADAGISIAKWVSLQR